MAKDLKSSSGSERAKRPKKGKLSLFPLSLESALGAALLTGPPPRDEVKEYAKKPVDKLRSKIEKSKP